MPEIESEEPEPKPHRPKCFKLYAPPYSYKVHVCIGTRAQGTAWLKRLGVEESHTDLTGCKAYTVEPAPDNDGARVLLWLHPEEKLGALVHEITHCAVFILRGSGIPITADNDEALAYLVEHLFTDAIWKWARPPGAK